MASLISDIFHSILPVTRNLTIFPHTNRITITLGKSKAEAMGGIEEEGMVECQNSLHALVKFSVKRWAYSKSLEGGERVKII